MKKQLDIAKELCLIFLKPANKWHVAEKPLIQRQPHISLLENFTYMLFLEALRLPCPCIHSEFFFSCKVLCMSVYTDVCVYMNINVDTQILKHDAC